MTNDFCSSDTRRNNFPKLLRAWSAETTFWPFLDVCSICSTIRLNELYTTFYRIESNKRFAPKDCQMRKSFTQKPQPDAPGPLVKNYITPSGLQRLKDERHFLLTKE